jgi:putative transposase
LAGLPPWRGGGGRPAAGSSPGECSCDSALWVLAGLLRHANCVSAPRIIQPGSTYVITRRTSRRHHLFSPDAAIRALFVFVLSFCVARFGILVHAVVLMSTHEHIVLTDPRGVLPDFLRELHRLIALGTKVLRAWEGAVWDAGKTSVVQLKTPEAIIEKIAYCMANPVAAGLVRTASEWPGLTTAPSELGRAVLEAERPKFFFDADNGQWPERVEVHLTMPPALEGTMTRDELEHRVSEELKRQETEARQAVAESGRSFLGADRCKKSSPYRRSHSFEPLRDRNPTFAVGRGNREALLAAAEEVRAFRRAYREALRQWREGVRSVAFPPGTWLMRRLHDATVEPLAA